MNKSFSNRLNKLERVCDREKKALLFWYDEAFDTYSSCGRKMSSVEFEEHIQGLDAEIIIVSWTA